MLRFITASVKRYPFRGVCISASRCGAHYTGLQLKSRLNHPLFTLEQRRAIPAAAQGFAVPFLRRPSRDDDDIWRLRPESTRFAFKLARFGIFLLTPTLAVRTWHLGMQGVRWGVVYLLNGFASGSPWRMSIARTKIFMSKQPGVATAMKGLPVRHRCLRTPFDIRVDLEHQLI